MRHTALTREEFLRAAAASAGLLVLGGGQATAAARGRVARSGLPRAVSADRVSRGLSFYSEPDLHPPSVKVEAAVEAQAQPAEGYAFFAPASTSGAQAGALIVDMHGEPVWFQPVPRGTLVSSFKVQQYLGQPVLTWWEGTVHHEYGRGEGVIVDSSYQEIARVRARNGRRAELHEFLLTPEGTALITCYPRTVRADLSAVGGPRNGRVFESIIQEVDVRTGRLLMEWRSLEHVKIAESYAPLDAPYDYMHANSIDLAPDGNLLIGARHTWALYKLERRTGRVIWRLGGKRSDFAIGRGARFAWQHDARYFPGDVITLFDDGAGPRKTQGQSRGLVLDVDHAHRRVRLARAYAHRPPWLSLAMGNMQTLSDGNVVLGWGNVPMLSEFAPDGSPIMDLWLPWGHASYRSFRLPWNGQPKTVPAVAVHNDPSTGNPTVYVSWNGATAVSAWQLSAGPTSGGLHPFTVAPRQGFETAIALSGSGGYAAVTALDASGRPLATSPTVEI